MNDDTIDLAFAKRATRDNGATASARHSTKQALAIAYLMGYHRAKRESLNPVGEPPAMPFTFPDLATPQPHVDDPGDLRLWNRILRETRERLAKDRERAYEDANRWRGLAKRLREVAPRVFRVEGTENDGLYGDVGPFRDAIAAIDEAIADEAPL
jgi:hypothetical protein